METDHNAALACMSGDIWNTFRRVSISTHRSDHVYDSEYNDPHRIYEMPIKGQHIQSLRVLSLYGAQKREDHNNRKKDQAHCYVKTMQTNQRIVSCSKRFVWMVRPFS